MRQLDTVEKIFYSSIVVLTVLTAVLLNTYNFVGEDNRWNVSEVVDGDTVKVERGGEIQTVRAVGIDAPEKYGENHPPIFDMEYTQENVECLDRKALEADRYVKNLLENRTVQLVDDRLEGPRDLHDRRLAYIFVNGKTVGQRLVEKGHATVFPTQFRYRGKYQQLEQKAREEGRGLWDC